MLLVILLQKWSAELRLGQREIVTQTMALQRGLRLWKITHFSPSRLWMLLMLMKKRGRATTFFLLISSYPLQVQLAPPERQSWRSAWPFRRSSCPPPSTPVCMCEITGHNLAQKDLTGTNILCLKDSYRSYSVASYGYCMQMLKKKPLVCTGNQ